MFTECVTCKGKENMKYLIAWCLGAGNRYDGATIVEADTQHDAEVRGCVIALEATKDRGCYTDIAGKYYSTGVSVRCEKILTTHKDTLLYKAGMNPNSGGLTQEARNHLNQME